MPPHVIVESVGKRPIQRLQLGIKRFEILTGPLGNLEPVRRVVHREDRRTVEFGITACCQDERVLDLPQKIFRLCVPKPEDHALVGRPIDVRHTPFVAMDRHLTGQRRHFVASGGGNDRRENQRPKHESPNHTASPENSRSNTSRD